MSTATLRRYRLTVALPRPAGADALIPPGAHARAELAAAMVGVEDLLTAWTAGKTLLSMLIGSECQPDALSAGWAVARALCGADGATVKAEQVPVR